MTRTASACAASGVSEAEDEGRAHQLHEEGDAQQQVAPVQARGLLDHAVQPLEAESLHDRGGAVDLAGDETEGDAAGDEPGARQAITQLEDETLLLGKAQ